MNDWKGAADVRGQETWTFSHVNFDFATRLNVPCISTRKRHKFDWTPLKGFKQITDIAEFQLSSMSYLTYPGRCWSGTAVVFRNSFPFAVKVWFLLKCLMQIKIRAWFITPFRQCCSHNCLRLLSYSSDGADRKSYEREHSLTPQQDGIVTAYLKFEKRRTVNNNTSIITWCIIDYFSKMPSKAGLFSQGCQSGNRGWKVG